MRKGRIGVGRSAGRVGCGILPAELRASQTKDSCGGMRDDAVSPDALRTKSLNSAMRSSLFAPERRRREADGPLATFQSAGALVSFTRSLSTRPRRGDGSVQLSRQGGGRVFECSSSCVVCRGRVRSLVLRHRHEREKETERDREREVERENKKKRDHMKFN